MIKKIALAMLAGTCLACEDQITINTQSQVISEQQKEINSLKRTNNAIKQENLKLKASVESINCRVAEQIKFQQYLDSRRNISHENAY